jgi:hypothetical protein
MAGERVLRLFRNSPLPHASRNHRAIHVPQSVLAGAVKLERN